MNKTLTDEQRRDIVRYRMESAESTLAEVETQIFQPFVLKAFYWRL